MRRHAPLPTLIAAALATFAIGDVVSSQAPGAPTLALLERYARGDFTAVVADLERITDFKLLLEDLERDAPGWIAAGGDADRERRELAAATFALEAARVDEWNEWKHVVDQPLMTPPPPPAGAEPSKAPPYKPRDVLRWQAPPLLIEWGCRLMSKDPVPRPIERWWQLAALAVAQRSEDFQFLVGNPFDKREFANPQDEIEHLLHVVDRFPDEPRFLLAQGIAVEWRWPEHAAKVFVSLTGTPGVNAEAAMRLGRVQSSGAVAGNQRNAPETLLRAERLTRDPYVVYLARFFRGQHFERRGDLDDAERAYRGAVAAVPHAQSATMALSAVLFARDRRAEAETLASAMLAARPRPIDPWHAYAHADDRFWPQLIARLRREIAR